MSSRRRLCGTANAGSGADPVATTSIDLAALEHARTDPSVETGQPEHQNASSHGNRSTSAASADMLVERFQALASEVLVHPVHELVGR